MDITSGPYPFQDPSLALAERVADLVARLTVDEKIALLHQFQPAIPRLGLAPFKTGTEALHGVGWLGTATVFPQAIGLGSTWNPALLRQIGAAVGDEARGFYARNPVTHGLNIWAPVVDLLRDPRAGRNEEGYAEDAYLTAQLALAYSGGLQGDHPFYLKTAPVLKHFFAYNNEVGRDVTSSNVSPRLMHEYYFKPFKDVIAAGQASGVMTSYNLVNGRPNTLSPYLNTLVRSWSDQPLLIVSDAWGPSNIANSQRYYPTHVEGHAAALKAGLDSFTDQGEDATLTTSSIVGALEQGLIAEADLDAAVGHIMSIRMRLGELDPGHPYAGITAAVIDAPAHRALALQAAREQLVLLKNEPAVDVEAGAAQTAPLLPLDRTALRSIAVIGPRADEVLLDWYSGSLPYTITPLDAIRARAGDAITVHHAVDNAGGAAVSAARAADVALVIVGNHPTCNAGWAECEALSEGKEAVDRRSLSLDDSYGQETLIQQVFAANPNTVVVLVSSFPYTICWTEANVPAILWSSHAGQELGNALADALFGDYAPAGRLTQTWYRSAQMLTDILDYDIATSGRTYLYYDGTPLYPFGHGLTYVPFTYSNLRIGPQLSPDQEPRLEGSRPLASARLGDSADGAAPVPPGRLRVSTTYADHAAFLRLGDSAPDRRHPGVAAQGQLDAGNSVPAATLLPSQLQPGTPPTGMAPGGGTGASADATPEAAAEDLGAPAVAHQHAASGPGILAGAAAGSTLGSLGAPADAAPQGAAGEGMLLDLGDQAVVSVDVTNAGALASDEVVQLYLRARRSRVSRPLKELKGFRRVLLLPGQTTTVSFTLPIAELALWDVTRDRFVLESGSYEIMVGRSSADIRLCAELILEGETIPPRDLRRQTRAESYDDYSGARLVPETLADGTAVELEAGQWIAFQDVDLDGGLSAFMASVAREGDGLAALEVRLDRPAGPLLGTLVAAGTGGWHSWSTASAELVPAAGRHAIYLVAQGSLRISAFKLE